jgi:hypothetical protein
MDSVRKRRRKQMWIKAETLPAIRPPRSGLVQLLSELPAVPAVYSGTLQSEKSKICCNIL